MGATESSPLEARTTKLDLARASIVEDKKKLAELRKIAHDQGTEDSKGRDRDSPPYRPALERGY